MSYLSDLALPADWDQDTDDMIIEEDLVSENSNEEASKVLEHWQADDQDQYLDIAGFDEQLSSSLLDTDIFRDPCASPTGPLEELESLKIDVDGFDGLLMDVDEETRDTSETFLPFKEQYKLTLRNLAESMKRSQETRNCLTIVTHKTAKYSRQTSVTGVVSSTKNSSQKLQDYLNNVKSL